MSKVCKVCGEPGFIIQSTTRGGNPISYQYTVCRQHFSERARRLDERGRKIGDTFTDKGGYVWVVGERGNIQEHKLVMEEKIGRPLRKGESVHHINGIRDDNRPENLELWIGGIRYGQRAHEIVCPHCGVPYAAKS